jgi:hypothetical protein
LDFIKPPQSGQSGRLGSSITAMDLLPRPEPPGDLFLVIIQHHSDAFSVALDVVKVIAMVRVL